MVDFGANTHIALVALCAALFSIVVYSVGASIFGIPTSESHSLIAGLTGAALATQGGLDGVNMNEWVKVLYGLVLSLAIGFALGWGICKGLTLLCRNIDRRRANGFFTGAQIFGAAAMSFMHGAQDGQKFIGVLLLGVAFCNGQPDVSGAVIPVWLMVLCSTVMGIGTSVGGREDHQVRGHGHGQAREVPGVLCRPRGRHLHPHVHRLRHPRLHDAHQDQRHHGRRRREASLRHQTSPWCATWSSPGSSRSRAAASSASSWPRSS